MKTMTYNGKNFEVVGKYSLWVELRDPENGKTFAIRKLPERTHQEAVEILRREGFPEEHISILKALKETKAIKYAKTYLNKFYPEKWAYFQGTTGTGKTTAAVFITYYLLRKGKISGAFYKAGYKKTERLEERIKDFHQSILVVVDDIGAKPSYDQKDDISEILFTAVDHKKPVIMTSNYNWQDIALIYGDQRLLSRFRQKIVLFDCGKTDLRAKQEELI